MKKSLAFLLTVSSVCALEEFAFPKHKDINSETLKMVAEFRADSSLDLPKDSPQYRELWVMAAKKLHKKLLLSECLAIKDQLEIIKDLMNSKERNSLIDSLKQKIASKMQQQNEAEKRNDTNTMLCLTKELITLTEILSTTIRTNLPTAEELLISSNGQFDKIKVILDLLNKPNR